MSKKPTQPWNYIKASNELMSLLDKHLRSWEGDKEAFVKILQGSIDVARGVGGALKANRPRYSGLASVDRRSSADEEE